MESFKITLKNPDPRVVQKAVEVFKKGGIVAHPTDTCYGLAVDIFSKWALKRLYALKKMSLKKPVTIMVENFKEARKYGKFSRRAQQLAKKYWPGALTLVLPRTKEAPKFLNPGFKTIGVRIPNSQVSLSLIKTLGRPLTTTSANLTGGKSPYSIQEIGEQIQPDLVLDGGKLPFRKPSTIVEVKGEEIRIIRRGDENLK